MITQILDRVNAENDTHFNYVEELVHLGYAEEVLLSLIDYLEEQEIARAKVSLRNPSDIYGEKP